MIKALSFPRFISIPRVVDLFTPLLFLYFVTLHADQLHFHFKGNIRLNNLLAMALLIVLMVRLRRDFFRIDRWLALSLLGIVAALILSMIFSPHLKRCILFAFWFFWTLLCYLWMPYQLVSKLDRQKVLKLFFSSYVCVGIYAFCQLATGPLGDPFVIQRIPPIFGRPNAFCYEPSYYVLYMCPFIFYQTVLYLGRDRSVSGRQLAFIYILFLSSASASAIASFLTFFALILFFKKLRKRALVLGGKLFLWMLPVFIVGGPIAMNYFLKNMAKKDHGSINERMVGIQDCWTLFKQRPLIGYGLGGAPSERVKQNLVFERYKDSPSVNIKDAECTNIVTELLASLGVIGTTVFVLMIVLFVRHYFKVRRGLQDDAFLLAILVMLVTWQFCQSLMRTYCWAFFAVAAASLGTTQQSQQSPSLEGSGETQDRVS